MITACPAGPGPQSQENRVSHGASGHITPGWGLAPCMYYLLLWHKHKEERRGGTSEHRRVIRGAKGCGEIFLSDLRTTKKSPWCGLPTPVGVRRLPVELPPPLWYQSQLPYTLFKYPGPAHAYVQYHKYVFFTTLYFCAQGRDNTFDKLLKTRSCSKPGSNSWTKQHFDNCEQGNHLTPRQPNSNTMTFRPK